MNENKKTHRAWIVLAGCTMIQSATSGIINNVGQFYKPLSIVFSTAEKTVGISNIALGRTIQILTAALLIFFVGSKVLEKYFKPTLYVCSVIYAAHYFALSRINSLSQMYILMVFGGVAISVLQILVVVTTINRWFHKSKGLAISISTAGAGLCSIIFSSVTGNIIEYQGWRMGFVFFGAVTFILTLTGTILIDKSPEIRGLKPYGWDEKTEKEQTALKNNEAFKPHKSVFKRPELYLIMFVYSSFQFLMTSTAHTSSYATSIGYGIVASAYISSVGLAGNTSVKMLMGILRDRFGTTKAGILEFVLAGTGYILLLLNINVVTLYIGVFLVGSVMSTATVISPMIQSEHFKGDDFTKAFPFITMIGNTVGAFANFFYGWVCDITGSYSIIFIICICLMIIDTVLMLMLQKIKKEY